MRANPSVIVAGARTPTGRLLGSLKDFSGADLGGVAIKAALERAGVTGDQVDYVILGQVLQAGTGQLSARQAAVKGGIPMDVPSITVNKVCLSGLDAIALADQLIRAGEFEIVVAGGMESMTNAPHLLTQLRGGVKYGDSTVVDSMAHDGLFCAFDQVPMGLATDRYNERYAVTREEQDVFSARSHQRAAEAAKNGLFDEELVPVAIPQRKGDPLLFAEDEGIRADTTAESLSRLRPAFSKEGTITAGSASQISDGACAVVVMSRAKAEELGLPWLAEIGAHGVVAGPDASLHEQPAHAIEVALERDGLTSRRPRPDRDQRGVRSRRPGLAAPTRRLRRQAQRQRRGDRPRPPDRGLRCATRAASRARAPPPRRWPRRRRTVRWRGPGRRAAAARPERLTGDARGPGRRPRGRRPRRGGPRRAASRRGPADLHGGAP